MAGWRPSDRAKPVASHARRSWFHGPIERPGVLPTRRLARVRRIVSIAEIRLSLVTIQGSTGASAMHGVRVISARWSFCVLATIFVVSLFAPGRAQPVSAKSEQPGTYQMQLIDNLGKKTFHPYILDTRTGELFLVETTEGQSRWKQILPPASARMELSGTYQMQLIHNVDEKTTHPNLLDTRTGELFVQTTEGQPRWKRSLPPRGE
jgi:hypothetical protein